MAGVFTSLASILVGSSGPTPPTPDILWWKCNDGSGTTITADVGPNGTTGGTWTSSTQSGSGFALAFNGTTDTGANSNSNVTYGVAVATVMFWINSPSWGANEVLLESSNGAGSAAPNAFLIKEESGLQFYLYGDQFSGQLQVSVSTLSTGTWHHVAVIIDNSSTAGAEDVYIDGVQQTPTVVSNTKTGSGNFTAATLYGAARASAFDKFTGSMDDFRVYSGALTGAQILAIFNAGSA